MNSNKLNFIILIIFPFLYLFPHTLNIIEMGNDFELLYYSYKKYIFEFISIGHFPLWSPSESAGYSLIFNPFAQYFYPLSWLLYGLSYLIGDLSKHLYLLYTIFGISIYNVGQYLWLKKLNIDIKYCLVSTLIICAGLKLTEILRFSNAIHTFCWFPWILYGMTLSLKKGFHLKTILIIFISTLSILTAGYPYYIIYGLIFFSSYFLFISNSYVKNLIIYKYESEKIFLFLIKIIVPSIIAFIIVSPWLFGIQDVVEITRDRNLQDISFSRMINSDVWDHLGSWIFPPLSQVETNYYFGSITTIIILIYLINFFTKKEKSKIEFAFIIFFILFFLLNFQISNSQNSIFFKFIWEKIDFIKNLRAFGRINILLLPFFSVLICFSIKSLIEGKYSINFNKSVLFVGIIILILQIFIIEFSNYKNWYWDTWQAKRLNQAALEYSNIGFIFSLYNNYIYPIFFALVTIILIITNKFNFLKNLIFIILILVVAELFILANIQWAIPSKYYDANGYNQLSSDPMENLRNSFNSKRVSTEVKGNTYFRNNRKFNINYFDAFGVDSHTIIFDIFFDRKGEFRKEITKENRDKITLLWGLKDNKKVFFTDRIDFQNIGGVVTNINENIDNFNNEILIDLKKFDGDEITITYNAKKDGYISYIDNWSPGWIVLVNNEEKRIDLLLNTYKSVKVNKGKNIINFKYKPWSRKKY